MCVPYLSIYLLAGPASWQLARIYLYISRNPPTPLICTLALGEVRFWTQVMVLGDHFFDGFLAEAYRDLSVNPYRDLLVNPYRDSIAIPYRDPLANSYSDLLVNPYMDLLINPYRDLLLNSYRDSPVHPYRNPVVALQGLARHELASSMIALAVGGGLCPKPRSRGPGGK